MCVNKTDLRNLDEFFVSDVTVLDILKFAMTAELQFLLQDQKKLSIINAKVKKYNILPTELSKLCPHGMSSFLFFNPLTESTAELYKFFSHLMTTFQFYLQLFLLSCSITQKMVNTEYLDVSDNLLTDLTLSYMLCDGDQTLQELRVLNISGNPLKVSASNLR